MALSFGGFLLAAAGEWTPAFLLAFGAPITFIAWPIRETLLGILVIFTAPSILWVITWNIANKSRKWCQRVVLAHYVSAGIVIGIPFSKETLNTLMNSDAWIPIIVTMLFYFGGQALLWLFVLQRKQEAAFDTSRK